MTAPAQSRRISGSRRWWPSLAAAVLLALSLAAFWPGVAMFDTVTQYQQVLSGHYDDWHPPVMARLWALLHPLGPGTSPLFVLQLLGYWLGLGALAQALGGRRALAVLLVAAFPVFLGWQLVILKDGQLVAALTAAIGLAALYLLRARAIPWPALAAILLCLTYATLLRANAAFSTVPLAVLLLLPGTRLRIAATLAGIPLAILAAQLASHSLLKARDSGVSRVEAIYDLSAIAVRTGDAGATGFTPAAIGTLDMRHCVKPLFWDPLMGRDDCTDAVAPLTKQPTGRLYARLVHAMLTHPLAYAAHRLAHLNATLRWLVPYQWPLAAPAAVNEPNRVGLADPPCCVLLRWQILAGKLVETPLGWPILWLLLGLWAVPRALTAPPGPRRDLAVALIASALCQEASFAVLSISSDLRYHLWSMIAVALAWVLLWPPRFSRRQWVLFAVTLALVLVPALIARATLPRPPLHYDDLLL